MFNKDLYLQACLERRRTFTNMVYSADGIPGAEALAAQKRFAALLGYKLKREYSEMCGFVRARMSLAIVRSNSLLFCGPRNKWARIRQQPELTDGTVMSLITPWRGYILGGRPGRTGRGNGRKKRKRSEEGDGV